MLIILSILYFRNSEASCDFEKKIKDGGYVELTLKRNVLVDVVNYIENDDVFFFSTGPIYGKPEVGAIDCKSGKKKILVIAKNTNSTYPNGADFFKLKSVERIGKNNFLIKYFFSRDVDHQDFKKFEIDKNLESLKFRKN